MGNSFAKQRPHFFVVIATFVLILVACNTSLDRENEKIIYLDYDENGIAQLYLFQLGSDTPRQLTTHKTDVIEYAISADGAQIAFAAREINGANSLWVLDWNGRKASTPQQIRNCPTATCTQLEWHPDGQRLLYEKRAFATPNLPTIWWIDVNSDETTTILTDPNEISSGTAVSPDGKWLSYVSQPTESIQFVNLDSNERYAVPSNLGSPAVWHPDSQQSIIRANNVTIYHSASEESHSGDEHDFAEAVHLFSNTIQSTKRTLLNNTGNVDDGNAAWSPDGEWIAFGRKVYRTNTGRQLWIMRADGSDPQPLTDELRIHYGPPKWSIDGRILLFQKTDLSQPDPRPSIWQLDLESKQMEQITPSGWLPNWLP